MKFETVKIKTEFSQAEICTYGAQVLAFSFTGSNPYPVLWLGKHAVYENGSAIRGGVPICWPWFGASGINGRPPQGFARLCQWDLLDLTNHSALFSLPMKNVPREWIDFPFQLNFEVKIGRELELKLSMKNLGARPVEITSALHTYFAAGNCHALEITGLENIRYTVKDSGEFRRQHSPLRLNGECCRLYHPHSGDIILNDPVWKRKLRIHKEGSASTLVWNPGKERCRAIPDMSDGEYLEMVCIEANNAGADRRVLYPDVLHILSQNISIQA